ncbi:hypothetical protein JAAARDRAFT_201344 [Jaapia argillacea MUCL 33604]|uniref:DUF6534 domain-containing protein n=1 Tax=Jaapia argillacea MUCL 33604 TaxID=933084 RepID=A0A067P1U2_9AGAM|nr:hypothetical protein JAAARDRAFT_201344 [Jaapia argillacea MUCL 33604]
MTVHITSFFAWMYWDFITTFGNFPKLNLMPVAALIQLLAIYISAFISQWFVFISHFHLQYLKRVDHGTQFLRNWGVQISDSLLDKLKIYSINRGALTTLAAFLNMLLFVLRPEMFIFMIPFLPSGQLYLISVTTS